MHFFVIIIYKKTLKMTQKYYNFTHFVLIVTKTYTNFAADF